MSKAFDDIQERELHQLQLMQENSKESCMTSFRLLHSFLQVLSYNESKSIRVSERALMTLFGQDKETFTSTIEMTEKLFAEYTRIQVKQFRETLLLHMANVKKSVAERTHHKRHGTKSDEHITSSSSGTYITHVVDADIRPVNDQVPSAEVHLTTQHNVLANVQQHTNQSEPSYDTYLLEKVDSNTTPDSTNMCHRGGEIDQDAEHDQVKSPLLKAEFLKMNDMEKAFANVALKNKLRKLKGNSVDTKFAKPSILGKPVLQPPRNQSVVRQPNAFKSERPNFLKPRFTSKVDVNNVLSKPVTPHYFPKVREYVLAKRHHVIAPGSSRNSQEEPYGLSVMAHNHYLEEARKKTQERNRNSRPSVMHTTSLPNTANGSKPNPRSNNQISKSLPASKSSCGMSNDNCNNKIPKRVDSRAKTCNMTSFLQTSSAVHEKPNPPRSCLRWKPTGIIFKIAGLRWKPTGKMFIDNTTKVDSEPPNGSNGDITNPYE
ncbi:hypothetical protein Tco_0827471 [Tanacetum coccineum]